MLSGALHEEWMAVGQSDPHGFALLALVPNLQFSNMAFPRFFY
jgi:hypothetical protein